MSPYPRRETAMSEIDFPWEQVGRDCPKCAAKLKKENADLLSQLATAKQQLAELTDRDIVRCTAIDNLHTEITKRDPQLASVTAERDAESERVKKLERVVEAVREHRASEQVQMLNQYRYDKAKYDRQTAAKIAVTVALADLDRGNNE
jgi:hypothetical protein